MNNAIFATEIFGMINLIIMIYGACFETKNKSRKRTAFLILSLAVFLTLGIDAASYLPVNWAEHQDALFVISLLAFISPFPVYLLFLQYIYLHISTKVKISRTLFSVGNLYCIAGTVICFVFGLKGNLFSVEGGVYQSGEYYFEYLLSYFIILLYTLLLVLVNVKKSGVHDSVAAIMFIVIPIFFIILNMADSDMAFSVSSLSHSMVIINTMIQGERENSLIKNEKEANEKANSDKLTGLYNRRMFSERCDRLGGSGSLGIIFSDLNGLKYTNDHFGHAAGDKLLCDYSDVLIKHFRKEDIFRISGDEFVVMIPGIEEGAFVMKAEAFISLLSEEKVPAASVGYSFGKESECQELVKGSEKMMYENKKKFHETFPEYSR